MTTTMTAPRLLRVGAVLLVQAVLVVVGCWQPLAARLTGEEVRLAVSPLDPIDPFRGAYVALDYPDLPAANGYESGPGEVYVPLARHGDVWKGATATTARPDSGPYLSCTRNWRLDCGIGSYFLPQDEALRMERELRDGTLVAVVRVDSRGNAALIRLEEG